MNEMKWKRRARSRARERERKRPIGGRPSFDWVTESRRGVSCPPQVVTPAERSRSRRMTRLFRREAAEPPGPRTTRRERPRDLWRAQINQPPGPSPPLRPSHLDRQRSPFQLDFSFFFSLSLSLNRITCLVMQTRIGLENVWRKNAQLRGWIHCAVSIWHISILLRPVRILQVV